MSAAKVRRFTVDGLALTVMELAGMCGVSYAVMHERLKSRGGDAEAAVGFRSRRGANLTRAARALSQHETKEAAE